MITVRFCGPVENLTEEQLREELTALEERMRSKSWTDADAGRIGRIRQILSKMESIRSGKSWET